MYNGVLADYLLNKRLTSHCDNVRIDEVVISAMYKAFYNPQSTIIIATNQHTVRKLRNHYCLIADMLPETLKVALTEKPDNDITYENGSLVRFTKFDPFNTGRGMNVSDMFVVDGDLEDVHYFIEGYLPCVSATGNSLHILNHDCLVQNHIDGMNLSVEIERL